MPAPKLAIAGESNRRFGPNPKIYAPIFGSSSDEVFGRLYEEKWGFFTHYVSGRYGFIPDTSQHVVQAAFDDLWKQRDRYDFSTDVIPLVISYIRERAEREVSRQQESRVEQEVGRTYLYAPSARVRVEERPQVGVNGMLAKLPNNYVVAWDLRHEQGLDSEEIGGLLGIPSPVVAGMLYDVGATLALQLGEGRSRRLVKTPVDEYMETPTLEEAMDEVGIDGKKRTAMLSYCAGFSPATTAMFVYGKDVHAMEHPQRSRAIRNAQTLIQTGRKAVLEKYHLLEDMFDDKRRFNARGVVSLEQAVGTLTERRRQLLLGRSDGRSYEYIATQLLGIDVWDEALGGKEAVLKKLAHEAWAARKQVVREFPYLKDEVETDPLVRVGETPTLAQAITLLRGQRKTSLVGWVAGRSYEIITEELRDVDLSTVEKGERANLLEKTRLHVAKARGRLTTMYPYLRPEFELIEAKRTRENQRRSVAARRSVEVIVGTPRTLGFMETAENELGPKEYHAVLGFYGGGLSLWGIAEEIYDVDLASSPQEAKAKYLQRASDLVRRGTKHLELHASPEVVKEMRELRGVGRKDITVKEVLPAVDPNTGKVLSQWCGGVAVEDIAKAMGWGIGKTSRTLHNGRTFLTAQFPGIERHFTLESRYGLEQGSGSVGFLNGLRVLSQTSRSCVLSYCGNVPFNDAAREAFGVEMSGVQGESFTKTKQAFTRRVSRGKRTLTVDCGWSHLARNFEERSIYSASDFKR